MRHSATLGLLFPLLLAGCSALGPKTIPRDRFDYNAAISDSWKEQTLLNIVKLRYADMPLFVEVASVVSGYTLESSVNVLGTATDATPREAVSVGGSAKYTDRPTITYAPITGNQFNKSFLTPIPPRAILFLIQSGWTVDLIFPLTVDSINGLRSGVAAGASQRAGDPGYYRVVELFHQIQSAGGTGMQIRRDEDDQETNLLIIHKQALSEESEAAFAELAGLLGLQQGLDSYTTKYGYLPADDTEIAMITRSMLQIIITLATQVTVPEEHVASGRTVPSVATNAGSARGRLQVHCGDGAPEDAFVSVRYRDTWYWIDDGDFASKVTFTFVMVLFSLTESGDDRGLPLVTIPAS
jgi:hypothetical protein